MERVVGVTRPRVPRRHLVCVHHLESGVGDPPEQVLPRAQPQPFSQVGKDEPPLPARREVTRQPVEETVQHVRSGVVDALLQRGRGAAGDPRRVAHHHVGAHGLGRPQVRLHDAHPVGHPEAPDVVGRAGHGSRVDVGRHHRAGPAPRHQDGEYSGAGSYVDDDGLADPFPERGLGHQIKVLLPRGREHPVGGVDLLSQRRHLDTGEVPLVRAHDAQQLGQRHESRRAVGARR